MKNIMRKVLRTSIILAMAFGGISQGLPIINMNAEEIRTDQVSAHKLEVETFATQAYGRAIKVMFPDVRLAEAIRQALKKTSIDDVVTIDELDRITTLAVSGADEEMDLDIDGIWYLRKLSAFTSGLPIDDVMDLLGVHDLASLTLSNVKSEDLDIIGNLRNLTKLVISYTGIKDISPLANLTQLEELDISNNEIRDLSPLSDLPNLKAVYARSNLVEDVEWMVSLPKIAIVNLDDNKVTDISPLKHKVSTAYTRVMVHTSIRRKALYDEYGFAFRHRMQGLDGSAPNLYAIQEGVTYEAPYITWSAELLKKGTVSAEWLEGYRIESGGGGYVTFYGEYNLEVVGL